MPTFVLRHCHKLYIENTKATPFESAAANDGKKYNLDEVQEEKKTDSQTMKNRSQVENRTKKCT